MMFTLAVWAVFFVAFAWLFLVGMVLMYSIYWFSLFVYRKSRHYWKG